MRTRIRHFYEYGMYAFLSFLEEKEMVVPLESLTAPMFLDYVKHSKPERQRESFAKSGKSAATLTEMTCWWHCRVYTLRDIIESSRFLRGGGGRNRNVLNLLQTMMRHHCVTLL